MGALILLLVIIGRQARRQATVDHLRRQQELHQELKAAIELAEYDREVVRQSQNAGYEQLQTARLALGHLEDHTRRLRKELAQLEAEWQLLQDSEQLSTQDSSQLQQEIDKLETLANSLRQEVENLRRQLVAIEGGYCVIPYFGPFGTARRPIYLECQKDAIILQPEGIRFEPKDFSGPMGPGNPLDSVLRAIREYWLRQDPSSASPQVEPYPLLLVRPEGITAFYAARTALESWRGEFGYELIEEDWPLVFPPADPRLAEELTEVVTRARRRQELLLASLPRNVQQGAKRYVLAPGRGGLIAEDGGPARVPARPTPAPPPRASQEIVPNASVPQSFDTPSAFANNQSMIPADQNNISANTSFAQEAFPSGPMAKIPFVGHGIDEGQTASFPATPPADNLSPNPPEPSWGNIPLPPAEGAPGRLGAASSDPTFSQPQRGEGPPVARLGRSGQSLAAIRGPDWALPPGSNALVPISRPVRVHCSAERLILVAEPGLGPNITIPWEEDPTRTVDRLVSELWKYVQQWESAGRGMIWRPELVLQVTPDGWPAFEKLQQLLAGSGLNVRLSNQP